ncbi:MAG TPA: 23S rRNA (uracil(1939)-C(5))-methyltransferase RlmD [Burkholderiales bacterium]|nr:23S rRNA (uracil(1939)-C(5))-methyltransferase RlmD [Burkholderiales bacterium]
MPTAIIESLDREGRGVAHVEGKAIFIEGALPGEEVEYSSYRKKANYEQAQTVRVLRQSAARTTPKCVYFGVCGGCAMQHIEPRTQVAAKQRVLEDAFRHIGKVRPERMLPPVHGMPWDYRHRARLSVRMVQKKGGVLVGFHEKRSSFVADMRYCEVLPDAIARLIEPLRKLVGALSIRERLPQIEVAIGAEVQVLVLRVIESPSPADEILLKAFADQYRIQFWLQTKGPETAQPFYPLDSSPLYYALPEFDVRIFFSPTDFTQVNHAVNTILVRRAMALLDPQPGERVLDLFCGLGNFTLPIARSGAEVTGIEGHAGLVSRAAANANANGLRAQFEVANLFEEAACARLPQADKWLLDPPREGAVEVVKAIGERGPHRIVYVSCDPATIARDAEMLVHTKGFALRAAGVVNMFPHTAHVESIALFERN